MSLSEGVAEDIQQCFNVNKKHMRVIHNPVTINKIKEKAKEICPLEKKHQYQFISVGRLHAVKDYPTLLEAYSIAIKEVDIGGWILEDGPEREYIGNLIKEKCLENSIELLGFNVNSYKYIKFADGLILSSLNEGFANVIIEAMAPGVPVIATDCDFGPREIITDGLNGILIPVGDADSMAKVMIALCKDDKLRTRVGAAGEFRSWDFNISEIGPRYSELFKNI